MLGSYNIRRPKILLKQYGNSTIFRIVELKSCKEKGFELKCKKDNLGIKNLNYNKEECQRVSNSRAKQKIRELALCNDFEYFATFTINPNCDRYNLKECLHNLRVGLKYYKKNNKDFKYLFVIEQHKDGAYHFHGLVSGVSDFYKNDNGYLSSRYWSKKLGYNSFSKIKDKKAVSFYITKYLTKNPVIIESGYHYISSRGLKTADSYEIVENTVAGVDDGYMDRKGVWHSSIWSNDYCTVQDFDLANLESQQILNFFKIKEGKTKFLSNIYNKRR